MNNMNYFTFWYEGHPLSINLNNVISIVWDDTRNTAILFEAGDAGRWEVIEDADVNHLRALIAGQHNGTSLFDKEPQ